ncbi:MAG TPA: DUF2332 domain-containing protein [Acidimicrobiia bacterium]
MPPPLTADQARAWNRYADTSPLYQRLNEVIADDSRLLDVLNSIERTPRHNVLFAGVQFLMMRDGAGPLADYYPNFADSPKDPRGVAVPFTDFVLGQASELIAIGQTRYTQTNECRRCVGLLPAIWATGVTHFHLVDFGTSAGLNLHLDRYRYRWNSVSWGPDQSPVDLFTELRGGEVTPLHMGILSRTGLDLNPLDPSDPDHRMWLEALVWPEHHDRRRRLQTALDVAAAHPVDLIAGDGLVTLPAVLERIPAREPALVINSFILNQLSPDDRDRYQRILASERARRPVYHVSMEWLDDSADSADIEVDDGTGLRRIGSAQPHGEWLELE